MRKNVFAVMIVAGMISLLAGCLASLPVDTTTPRMTKEGT
jgi:hypothetical protein